MSDASVLEAADLERVLPAGRALSPAAGAPAFAAAARQLEPAARLAKVNTEEEQGLAARFGIRSIPTLVVFRNGREIARQAGAMDTASIVRWLRSLH